MSAINSEETQAPVLGYYKLRGWAGPIRLLLAYLKINHCEKLYPVPTPETGQGEWAKEKYSLGLDFPNIPYWIDNLIKLTETKAILKHIARKHDAKLLGNSAEEQSRVNMLEEILWDMWIGLTKTCMENSECTKRDFLNEGFQKLKLLCDFIGNNNWAVGNNITYVDFLLYEILFSYQKFNPNFANLLQPFDKLRKFLEKFESIPSIRDYMNSSQFISAPYFSYKFMAKL